MPDTNEDPKPNVDQDPKPSEDTKYSITVAGEARQVTLAELQKLAERSAGADKRFEEAARLRQEAADAQATQDLLQRAQNDNDAFRELGHKLGRSDEEIDQLLIEQGRMKPSDDDDDKTPPPPALTPEQEADIQAGKQARVQQERERIYGEMHNLLDKDAVVGENVVKDPGARAAMFEMLESDVVTHMTRGSPYGPELLAASLQRVRERVERLGIRKATAGEDDTPEARLNKARQIGIGPSSKEMAAAIAGGKTVARVPVTDPDYADNFAARALLGPRE